MIDTSILPDQSNKCVVCGKTNPPTTLKKRRFCSKVCSHVYHHKIETQKPNFKEISRLRHQKYYKAGTADRLKKKIAELQKKLELVQTHRQGG